MLNILLSSSLQSTELHVKINATCCHPGYYYNRTIMSCVFNSDYPHLLRPTVDNRYVYLEVWSAVILVKKIDAGTCMHFDKDGGGGGGGGVGIHSASIKLFLKMTP